MVHFLSWKIACSLACLSVTRVASRITASMSVNMLGSAVSEWVTTSSTSVAGSAHPASPDSNLSALMVLWWGHHPGIVVAVSSGVPALLVKWVVVIPVSWRQRTSVGVPVFVHDFVIAIMLPLVLRLRSLGLFATLSTFAVLALAFRLPVSKRLENI